MAQMPGLELPSRRDVVGQGQSDEAGDRGGLGSFGAPLQGVGNAQRRDERSDGGSGWCSQRRSEQDPRRLRLIRPTRGREVGGIEDHRRRGQTHRVEGLALRQGPGRKQRVTGNPESVPLPDRRAPPRRDRRGRWSGRKPTRRGSLQKTVFTTPGASGSRAQVIATSVVPSARALVRSGSHIRCTVTATSGRCSAAAPCQVRNQHGCHGWGDGHPYRAGFSPSGAPHGCRGGSDLVEDDLGATEEFLSGAGDGDLAGGPGQQFERRVRVPGDGSDH